jgi:hypothetical protein
LKNGNNAREEEEKYSTFNFKALFGSGLGRAWRGE